MSPCKMFSRSDQRFLLNTFVRIFAHILFTESFFRCLGGVAALSVASAHYTLPVSKTPARRIRRTFRNVFAVTKSILYLDLFFTQNPPFGMVFYGTRKIFVSQIQTRESKLRRSSVAGGKLSHAKMQILSKHQSVEYFLIIYRTIKLQMLL